MARPHPLEEIVMSIRSKLRKIHLRPRGKNSKVAYQFRCLVHRLCPRWWLRQRAASLLQTLEARTDKQYILDRVEYYCKLIDQSRIHGEYEIGKIFADMHGAKNYYRDFFEYSRFFNPTLKVDTEFGDNTIIPETPSVTKSRPIRGQNANCVVLNLDKVRHFIFLKDKRTFREKLPTAIFRGICAQPHRIAFMEKYFGSNVCDCGDTAEKPSCDQWGKPLITLYDHLKYRYIISLEGNDVASNLKWVMSSNSIAVMPKPKYETWFMEGRLIPNVHYIQIKDDYSDLEERLHYYNAHPDEAEKIIKHAHEYVRQFQNKDREDLIHLLVLEKYFKLTNPGVAVWE
ncbi:MAG: lipopolysaccharide A protein [Duodenibacillus sp.]|nr:lipopolysaccharide A protein [Duodenibacillus sp.]